MDKIIVGIIVLLAVLFLVRKMLKSAKGEGGCGCGCGGSCSTSKKSSDGKLPPCCCGKK